MKRSARGVTLIEVLVAITLLSLLSGVMLMAMQIGLRSFQRVDSKLMDNRRVAGAQQIIENELEGLVPVISPCREGGPIAFVQGEPQVMRLVSTFSLQQGWRGQPQILEIFVIPGEEGRGVRLVVNELRYQGPGSAGQLCVGRTPDPETGFPVPRFAPVSPGPKSFVLADKLAYAQFSYLWPARDTQSLPVWKNNWGFTGWPNALRIDMAPLEADPSKLQPLSVMAPIHIHRSPEIKYVDAY
jgi:prepilin-type N-terminal cleavage/methylation domain-containing protein